MTKPTGRPRGRPKTKEYVTLMARVPQELADQVQRYARRHRQTLSDVLRDGLVVLVQDEEPYGHFLSDTNTVPAIVSDKNATAENVSDTVPSILSDTKEEQADMLSDSKEDQAALTPASPTEQPAILSDSKAEESAGMPQPPTSAPPFDTRKYTLGKLCPRRHAHGPTGQSLLRSSNRHCLACDREKFHERKQAKRQAQPA